MEWIQLGSVIVALAALGVTAYGQYLSERSRRREQTAAYRSAVYAKQLEAHADVWSAVVVVHIHLRQAFSGMSELPRGERAERIAQSVDTPLLQLAETMNRCRIFLHADAAEAADAYYLDAANLAVGLQTERSMSMAPGDTLLEPFARVANVTREALGLGALESATLKLIEHADRG